MYRVKIMHIKYGTQFFFSFSFYYIRDIYSDHMIRTDTQKKNRYPKMRPNSNLDVSMENSLSAMFAIVSGNM